jgi:nucleotide-binding universal stress UspA family protein
MNVLFATDGSESAARAQRLVASIDWPDPTRILVLHVDQLLSGDLDLPPEGFTELQEKMRAGTKQLLEAVKAALAGRGRQVSTATILGRPASVIVDEARRMPADVIVLGSHGRGAFTAVLLGSVAEEVVDHAPCPVLVARTEGIARSVLAADGSAGALLAEQTVTGWPFLRGLPTHVVTAWSIAPGYTPIDPMGGAFVDGELYQQLVDGVQQESKRIAADSVKRLEAAGMKPTSEVREAPAAQGIVAAARDKGADVIVIGTRGRTGLARLLLGSVARGVLHRAQCSVLTVRERGQEKR